MSKSNHHQQILILKNKNNYNTNNKLIISDSGSIIPSKPIIARRNSAANRLNGPGDQQSSLLLFDSPSVSSRAPPHHHQQQQFGGINNNNLNDLIDYELANSIDYYPNGSDANYSSPSSNANTERNGGKYDTVPNIRNSAKNRRKLEKIFSLSHSNAPANTNPSSKKTSLNENDNDNLYLSKLRAEKNNNNNQQSNHHNESSRYSPSNPESGFFSISDLDYAENNRFIKQQQQQQQLKSNSTTSTSCISRRGSLIDVRRASSTPTPTNFLLPSLVSSSTNTTPHPHPPLNLTHSNPTPISPLSMSSALVSRAQSLPPLSKPSLPPPTSSTHDAIIIEEDILFPKKPVLKSYFRSKLDVSGTNAATVAGPNGLKNQQQANNSNNNIEYNPLAGVSFKQTHSSDVEIVGVRLGNNTNSNQNGIDSMPVGANSNAINAKKKNSLKSNCFYFYNYYIFI